jgi:Bacteriophage Sf6, terminase small subunit-like
MPQGNLPSANSKLPVSPTIAKLNALPKRRYGNVTWPEGTPQPLTQEIADHFFSLMSTSDCSLVQLLCDHPELPPFRQLDSWRANNKNGFAERWRETRKAQAHFLVQKCLDLQKSVNAQNAHQVRVRFDILRWIAAKLHPAAYAEKPLQAPTQTVNVGIAISQERLADLRSRLEATRSALALEKKTPHRATAAKSKGQDSED